MLSGLMFKFLIQSELIFVGHVREGSSFIKKTIFSPLSIFGSLVNISCQYMRGFISELAIPFHWFMCLFLFQCSTTLITVAL